MYYFNARWYDPELGRFINEDPARDSGNWFAYVGNNPMSYVDRNGLEGLPVAPNVTGVGAGAAEYLGPAGALFMMGKAAWDFGANARGLYELIKQYATDARVIKVGLAANAAKDSLQPTLPSGFIYQDGNIIGKNGAAVTFAEAWKQVSSGGNGASTSSGSRFKDYLKLADSLNIATPRDSAVLWSGPGNRALAEKFASDNGKFTLEMTEGGKFLDSLKLFDPKTSPLTSDQASAVWQRVSQRFAGSASGSVTAFIQRSDGATDSIFNSIELPALMKNQNVSRLTFRGGSLEK